MSPTQLKNLLDGIRRSDNRPISSNYKISLIKTYLKTYLKTYPAKRRENYLQLYSAKTRFKTQHKLTILELRTLLYALDYDTSHFNNTSSATIEVLIILKLLLATNLDYNLVFELSESHFETLVVDRRLMLGTKQLVVEPKLFEYVRQSMLNLRALRNSRYNPKRPSKLSGRYFILNTSDSINKRLFTLFILVSAAALDEFGRGKNC